MKQGIINTLLLMQNIKCIYNFQEELIDDAAQLETFFIRWRQAGNACEVTLGHSGQATHEASWKKKRGEER